MSARGSTQAIRNLDQKGERSPDELDARGFELLDELDG
jgi:hypothetical protein